jgi:hypothetical protein
MRRGEVSRAAALATLAILTLSACVALAQFDSVRAATDTVSLVRSGLVASDSLTTGDTSYWAFGNSGPGVGTYSSSEDSQGLRIGAESTVTGDWVYNGATSPGTAASLFHASVSLLVTSVANGQMNSGIYVGGGNGNYVDCAAVVGQNESYWVVESATSAGSTDLYQSATGQPTAQDCTVITNGSNYLKVYIGGTAVYSRSTLTLGLSTPLEASLQLDTSSTGTMDSSAFLDYYATQSEAVTVTGAPPGGTAQMVDSSNDVLATGAVNSTGAATLLVGMYALPLSANIDVYDGSDALVASTPAPATIWGGDVYRVGSESTTTSTSTTFSAPQTLVQTSSGLLASDPLTTGNTSYWTFGGDAASQPGAKYAYSEDVQGLHIGAQSPAGGTYAGYYAVSPNSTGSLFHATVTLANTSVPADDFNTGLYVQTWNKDFIDYIGCLALSDAQGYYWTVVQSYGAVVGAQDINTLYESPLNTMPLTQGCTIITNGNNYLKVYLGGSSVVDRDNLTLNMPAPFQAYLEPQTSYASSMLFGTYTDYYETTSEGVSVTNGPLGGTAEIVSASGAVLASAPVAPNGTATMPVGQYSLPLSGYINVYGQDGSLVASTNAAVNIWGGDAYTVPSATSTSTTSTTSTTSATSTTTTLPVPVGLEVRHTRS